MLILRIRKRVCVGMISQLNTMSNSHTLTEKSSYLVNASTSHLHTFLRTQLFSSTSSSTHASKQHLISLSIAKCASYSSMINAPVVDRSRLPRTKAQAALFDYLHVTRGIGFLDSEHISKNSPHFIRHLISIVKNEPDVYRALSKYFRFNPINEFEPFFESLGLSPVEFRPLLPQGSIYLEDEQVMLENYHVLCSYGVPRSVIGRVFKEAGEIFRFEDGVLNRKLRAYEQLGIDKSVIIKLVGSSPILFVGDVNGSLIRILDKLKDMGCRTDLVGGYLSNSKMYNWDRIFATLSFLGEVGYSDAEIGELIRVDITFLFEGSGKSLYVLVGALLKLGLSMNDIYAIFLKDPRLLSHTFTKGFWKALHFLIEIGMESNAIAKALCSNLKYFGSHDLFAPRTVLRNFKGNKSCLCETLKSDPSAFFKLAFKQKKCNPELAPSRHPIHFLEKNEFLSRIGYVENSDEMVKALKRFRGRGDQLQERFDCLVGAGFDFQDVSSMIKVQPNILTQSKESLMKKIDYLKEHLGYPVDSIVGSPSYLCYDMDRICSRLSMYAWVRDKGAAKPTISINTLLCSSDARFEKYFVNVHPEGPLMWEKLRKSLASS